VLWTTTNQCVDTYIHTYIHGHALNDMNGGGGVVLHAILRCQKSACGIEAS
jgi:hypothetical protein